MLNNHMRSISTSTMAMLASLPAYAATSELQDYAFTPFSAGIVGGIIAGLSSPNTVWSRFGVAIWFAVWTLVYTTVLAIHSDQPFSAIGLGLAISIFWGLLPFVLTFTPSCFVITRLRRLVERLRGKHA
jgi:hypothetical protein